MTGTNSEAMAAMIALAETGGCWRTIAKTFDAPQKT